MKKIVEFIVTVFLAMCLIFAVLFIYYPSFREGRANGRLTETVNLMNNYAVSRDNDPSMAGQEMTDKDPVSGRTFKLIEERGGDGVGWFLLSAGPDRDFDANLEGPFSIEDYIPYDPTNGVFSSGDILFSNDHSPGFRGHVTQRSGDWEQSYLGYTRTEATTVAPLIEDSLKDGE